MSETVPMTIEVGDQVRVHFHPLGPMKSFSEGVVRRLDVTTPEGRFFVVEVTHEVILDREHRMKPGFQDYVRYECKNDFPGRVEVLSTAGQDGMGNDEANQDTEVSLLKPQIRWAKSLNLSTTSFRFIWSVRRFADPGASLPRSSGGRDKQHSRQNSRNWVSGLSASRQTHPVCYA